MREVKDLESIYQIWINKYPSISKFKKLMSRGRLAEQTVQSYVNDIRRFCKFLGFEDPEKTLEHINNIEEKEEWLDGIVGKLMEKYGNTATTSMFKGVKRWLNLNKTDIDWRNIILPSVTRKIEDRAPTKAELKRLLSVANIRDKAFILVACSTGLRANTLRTLTFGDVNFDYPDVAKIRVNKEYEVNGKTVRSGRKIMRGKNFYVTFITPEAKKALLDYKKYREEQGEEITESSPLFTSVTKQNRGQMLNRTYISVHWGRLLKKAHLHKKSKSWHVLHLHTLKKFCETNLINAGVKPSYREFWLGHKGLYLESSYFKGEEQEHLKEYRKAIPHLSIIEAPTLSKEDVRKQIAESIPDEILQKVADERGETLQQLKLDMAFGKPETQKIEEKPYTELEHVERKRKYPKKEEDCQKLIEETELKEYLAKGYRFVSVLPSGKIVVED